MPRTISTKLLFRTLENDGGDHRQFGWGRYNPNLYHANGSKTLRIGTAVKSLRIYSRALRVSEAHRRVWN